MSSCIFSNISLDKLMNKGCEYYFKQYNFDLTDYSYSEEIVASREAIEYIVEEKVQKLVT